MSKFTFVKTLKRLESFLFFVNIILVGFAAVLILIHVDHPPLIPFWFSKSWGQERLAHPTNLWIIPGIGFAFFFLDFTLAQIIVQKRPILSRILAGASLLISLVLLFAIYKILLVVS